MSKIESKYDEHGRPIKKGIFNNLFTDEEPKKNYKQKQNIEPINKSENQNKKYEQKKYPNYETNTDFEKKSTFYLIIALISFFIPLGVLFSIYVLISVSKKNFPKSQKTTIIKILATINIIFSIITLLFISIPIFLFFN